MRGWLLLLVWSSAASAQVTTVSGRPPGDWEQPPVLLWAGAGAGLHSSGFGGSLFITALKEGHVGTLRISEGGPVRLEFGGPDEDDFPRQGGSREVALMYGRAWRVAETTFFATSAGIGLAETATERFEADDELSRSLGLALDLQFGARLRYVGAFATWYANLNRDRPVGGMAVGFTLGLHN